MSKLNPSNNTQFIGATTPLRICMPTWYMEMARGSHVRRGGRWGFAIGVGGQAGGTPTTFTSSGQERTSGHWVQRATSGRVSGWPLSWSFS